MKKLWVYLFCFSITTAQAKIDLSSPSKDSVINNMDSGEMSGSPEEAFSGSSGGMPPTDCDCCESKPTLYSLQKADIIDTPHELATLLLALAFLLLSVLLFAKSSWKIGKEPFFSGLINGAAVTLIFLFFVFLWYQTMLVFIMLEPYQNSHLGFHEVLKEGLTNRSFLIFLIKPSAFTPLIVALSIPLSIFAFYNFLKELGNEENLLNKGVNFIRHNQTVGSFFALLNILANLVTLVLFLAQRN